MIKIVCPKCQEHTDVSQDGYLEINLHDNTIYFKCPSCKKTTKTKLYEEFKGYPKTRRQG